VAFQYFRKKENNFPDNDAVLAFSKIKGRNLCNLYESQC